ncbi:MAG: asparaginase [Magnetospirillum sp.]|nr:asparaginase [Magnetospirillum sp.]
MATNSPNPVLVEVVRGQHVESRHRGAAVVADAAGRVVAAWGDGERPVYPRSAVKPLQTLPLLESGAAAAFGLGAEQIALAAASHGGDPRHVAGVAAWLERLGLGPDALECGAHPPSDPAAALALVRAGEAPSPLHNNCSGKHTGFLTLACHLGVDRRGYIGRDHPVQQRVARTLFEMTGEETAPWATDGCGIPTFALPLHALAMAMARLADPAGLAPARRQAAGAIVAAMIAHPILVAGSGRLCTEVMQAAPRIAVKAGAEGVFAAILPELGWGVALKIDDGAARAAEVAVLALLDRLGALGGVALQRLAGRMRPPVVNVAGKVVGELRAVLP